MIHHGENILQSPSVIVLKIPHREQYIDNLGKRTRSSQSNETNVHFPTEIRAVETNIENFTSNPRIQTAVSNIHEPFSIDGSFKVDGTRSVKTASNFPKDNLEQSKQRLHLAEHLLG
jgi:hypothetical protein